jgi:signal transduction histidine kinase
MGIWIHIRRTCAAVGIIFFAVASFACSAALATEPKRLMLLHSFGRDFRPWSEYAKSIRTELDRQSPWPLDITEHSLLTARSSDESSDTPFVGYLSALYSKRPLDLIVSLGAPAVAFVQQYRQQLFPNTPMVFTAVEQRRVQFSLLTPNDAVVAVAHDFPAVFENILKVLPDTKAVTVVNGASPLETFWLEELRRDLKPFERRIALTWTNDLSFEQILKHASALPPHSAIFWHLMLVDAVGHAPQSSTALTKLYAAAKAPIFSYDDGFFGRELVGGPMHSVLEGSRRTASVAVRILNGEKAGDIKIAASGFAAPKFDWREMQRWRISERRLPPGSEIHFRNPTAWEQYREQILAICAALILQAMLIGWLIYEHRRRNLAEVLARNSMAELTHMNRVATAGELSASIAHEVNQPLAAIVTSANAALRWLAANKPDLDKAKAALSLIVSEGHRAGDVITSVRSMFKKDTNERTPVEINELIMTVLEIVRVDLQKNGIQLETELAEKLPVVEAQQVQLQQVILNLVMNAIEAMQSVQQPRVLRIQSSLSKPGIVHVSIQDSGTGIALSNLHRLFDHLFTTKAGGMGMGLSICRSIIERHHGQLWASAGASRGAVFQFELPSKTNTEYAGSV